MRDLQFSLFFSRVGFRERKDKARRCVRIPAKRCVRVYRENATSREDSKRVTAARVNVRSAQEFIAQIKFPGETKITICKETSHKRSNFHVTSDKYRPGIKRSSCRLLLSAACSRFSETQNRPGTRYRGQSTSISYRAVALVGKITPRDGMRRFEPPHRQQRKRYLSARSNKYTNRNKFNSVPFCRSL